MSEFVSSFTARVVKEVLAFSLVDDPVSFDWGRHTLLDWLGVTLAGSREPSGRMAAEYLRGEGPGGPATVIGSDQTAVAGRAALANGVAAHALDFDDSTLLVSSHPSAGLLSAAVAVAEREGASPRRMIEALAAGHQGQALISQALGPSMYGRGFHTTGTHGTLGAALTCGRLLSLDPDRMGVAVGLAATMASGLKASFGTMGKHLNAGQAAANGVLAADLAAAGFTGARDAIEAKQGYAWTHSDDFDADRAFAALDGKKAIHEVQFKYHACCHGTHSAIEGVAELRRRHGFSGRDVEAVEVVLQPRFLDVCCIPDPQTGLEAKFSIRYATALALDGRPTGPASFTDEAVADRAVRDLLDRVTVIPLSTPGDVSDPTLVRVQLRDGREVSAAVNYKRGVDSTMDEQWTALARKFEELAVPVIGADRAAEIVDMVAHLEDQDSLTPVVRSAPVRRD